MNEKTILFISLLLVFSLALSAFAISAEEGDGQTGTMTGTGEPTSADGTGEPEEEQHAVEMNISDFGLEFIKSYEGYSAMPYEDVSHWSIGYGSYVCSLDDDPYEIYPNGISRAEADELYKSKIGVFIKGVNNFILSYDIVLNQNQFDALVSFTYNVGQNIWKRSVDDFTLKRILVAGDYTEEEITEAFYMWRHSGGKENAGLAKRRLREAALFNSDINVADPASQGYDARFYIVNASYLTVRDQPTASGANLGSIRKNTVIQIIETDGTGEWGFTTFAAYFGWVSLKYLIPLEQKDTVSVLNEECYDDQGVYYTLDSINMTASVGIAGTEDNTSRYEGINSGYVYLTGYIVSNSQVYTLTSIGDLAFANNGYINRIFIPASVTAISESAFVESTLYEIYYVGGSYADGYANGSIYEATDYRCVNSHSYGAWSTVIAGSGTAARVDKAVCAVCGKEKTKTVTSISIARMPNKLEYIRSQPFIQDGIIVNAVFDDGSTEQLKNGLAFSGFDSETLGVQTITVSHGIFSTSFTVKINEKEMTGISITNTPSVTTYVEGTEMKTSGLSVSAKYNNGTTEKVTEYTLTGYDSNKIGKQTITVSYNGFVASYSITVKAKSVTSISLLSMPYKTEYYCGESFDPDGITVRATYDNGTTEIISDGFTIKNFNSKAPADSQKVRVYYSGYYKNIYVTIILNRLQTEVYTIEKDVVYGVRELTTVAEFTSCFDASERITVYDILGHAMKNDDFVATDCTAVLWYNADKLDSLKVLIIGDLSGDGIISVSDYLVMKDYLMGAERMKNIMAYDINRDGMVTLSDMVCLIGAINKKELLDY